MIRRSVICISLVYPFGRRLTLKFSAHHKPLFRSKEGGTRDERYAWTRGWRKHKHIFGIHYFGFNHFVCIDFVFPIKDEGVAYDKCVEVIKCFGMGRFVIPAVAE